MPSIANILAIVSDEKRGAQSLTTAFRAGRHLNAHIDAFHVRTDPTTALPLVGEAMSGVMVDEMLAIAKQETSGRAGRARGAFKRLASEMGIAEDDGDPCAVGFSAAWIEDTGLEEEIVPLRASRADLIVLSRPTDSVDAASLATLNASLMQTGRPVLAAPPLNGTNGGPFSHVAVFWNGSAEVTRAVAGALPFFVTADQVTILRVEEDEFYAPTEDLECYLARHGVKGVTSKILPRDGRTGYSLLSATDEIGADMMVMGAYTRSKLRQLMMGSVTGYVMENAMLPVLLSH
jgi:nucleotide-binding universal stress UspA family protein